MNGDCVAGFFAGASSSILAGSNLTDEQKLGLSPLVAAVTGYFLSGGEAINVSFGSAVSQSGIVNNYLTHEDLANLQADLEECRASEDGCDKSEQSAIIEKYREISKLRDIQYYLCYTDACRFEHLSQMGSLEELRAAVGVNSYVGTELYLHGEHGLLPKDWLTDAVVLNVENEDLIRATCPDGDPACVVQAINDIQSDNAFYELMASIPGPDLAIAGYECFSGQSTLSCIVLAIEAKSHIDIPSGQTKAFATDYVADVFSGSGISADDYYAYASRKVEEGKVPIAPEDYRDFMTFRNEVNQNHKAAVGGFDGALSGQGLTTQTEVTFVGSDGTRARTDIVGKGDPGQVVEIPDGYTLEDLDGNAIVDEFGAPVTQVSLDEKGLASFEVKTGDACLTSNQSCVYDMQVNGDEVVSVGKNADNLRLEGNAPTTVYVIRKD